jgi:hypothetical protein
VFSVGKSATPPPFAADAPPARDNDNPAAPNTGTVLRERFRLEACFVRDMVESSHIFEQIFSLIDLRIAGSYARHEHEASVK